MTFKVLITSRLTSSNSSGTPVAVSSIVVEFELEKEADIAVRQANRINDSSGLITYAIILNPTSTP